MDISEEREEAIINNMTNAISKLDIELPFLLMAGAFVPVSTIISQTIVTPGAAFINVIGIDGHEIAAFLNKKENLRRLISKVEENKKSKEKMKNDKKKYN